MAKVKTPRFYVDYFQWAFAIGLVNPSEIEQDDDLQIDNPVKLFNLNPSQQVEMNSTNGWDVDNKRIFVPTGLSYLEQAKFNFFFALGHNFLDSDIQQIETFPSDGNNHDSIFSHNNVNLYDGYNGWTMLDFGISGTQQYYTHIKINFLRQQLSEVIPKIGAISVGNYYDIQSPDVRISMSREYGVSKQVTKGGATLVNTEWTSPSTWGNLPAWELSKQTINPKLGRHGRRVWDLSFSYLGEDDVFNIFNGLNDSYNPDGIMEEDTFYSQVIHKTMGGQLPFIFQQDRTNFSSDNFAICVFDTNSINVTQVTGGLYDINVKIKEVW